MGIHTRPRYSTVAALARHLGCAQGTVRGWIERGWLVATQVQAAHYTDDRPRVSGRGVYRIHEDELIAFLKRLRGGKYPHVPRSMLRGG